jgi:diguanylate cyclase (GGDEF)-like protein
MSANARIAAVQAENERLELRNIQLTRTIADLDQAQLAAQLGSWNVDLASGRVSWSRELHRLLDVGADISPTQEAMIDRVHPEDREMAFEAISSVISSGSSFLVEHRLQLSSGAVRWIRARGWAELDETGSPVRVLGTAQDITEQRLAHDALQHQMTHDPLTGLPNRADLLARLKAALAAHPKQPAAVGLIYLDIDRFQLINASLGLPTGDALLLETGERIAALLPPGLCLARVGGDEFAVLCDGGPGAQDPVALAERICAAMITPVEWSSGQLVMSVSAGVAVATSAAVSPHELLRDANAAMFLAKRSGRAQSVVFEPTLRAKALARLEMEVDLRRSLRSGDLCVHYQQIVSMNGRPLGHEALVRWNHPRRGMVSPDAFITIAEETGLIVPLGAWVLREACMQGRRFQRLAPQWSGMTMSVNLSGVQLNQPDLVETISAALHDTELRSEHLHLEMTESVLMSDAPTTIKALQGLKVLGVKLAIDDFGTGYSSLAYLRRFPVDVLKIDRTFVSGLGNDSEDSALVAAIVSLAKALGLATVAEGVETEVQHGHLVGLGCERAQGYLFGRPVPAAEAETALVNSTWPDH